MWGKAGLYEQESKTQAKMTIADGALIIFPHQQPHGFFLIAHAGAQHPHNLLTLMYSAAMVGSEGASANGRMLVLSVLKGTGRGGVVDHEQ